MLRSSGLRVMQRPGHELYLCQPDAALRAETYDLDMAQFTAATGTVRR
jgi:tRNA (mo5U34)-methyltransferase